MLPFQARPLRLFHRFLVPRWHVALSTSTLPLRPTNTMGQNSSAVSTSGTSILATSTQQFYPLSTSALYSPGSHQNGDINDLFCAVENVYPESQREHGWYLTMISTLIACGLQRYTGDLYLHLTSQPQYQTPEERQKLALRMREAHFKSIMISGIPKVMDSLASLASVEQEKDEDHTMTRQDAKLDKANSERGSRTLDILFKGMNDGIRSSWGSHSEISWISINISYGLFLADHRILDLIETELVVLPGIMCHNLGKETSWHVAGSKNVGIAPQDVRAVQLATNLVAEFAGLNLTNIKILEV